ncbi:thioredoxin family protein [Mycoplasmopsis gallopavonis]|uniref:Thioredoxin n=1 Tax=Mycoplasmopsis gallopavonis TaxID=76629 RepID=A0A449AZH5_9BACT|nr:thioredoxin domain-containing protein [Mycoplasmopsis gallopavonis]RIV16155.1 thioredoxin [Mycoplasmopsis gallopavonis]VEU72643.1 Thioredoxin [Mycoplasmopsis gallopavonis]VEU72887.1 Thioredoxin [Mycoplasmopsis gallopavonis]
MLKDVTKKELLENLGKGLQLVVFYADWCGPCRMFKGSLEELSEKDGVSIFRVNIDNERELAIEHNVSSIPYMVVYFDGKPVKTSLGYKPYEALKEELAAYL